MPQTIDPRKLFPNWHREKRLQEDITRKALDVPEDMNVQANRGVSGWAMTVLGVAAIAAFAWTNRPQPAPVVPPTPPAIKKPADSGYQVLFYDQHGNPIDVPMKD